MTRIKNNLVSNPSAWIVNTSDRGRKSIKNGKVYLKDSEEFQIELFNPLQECVLADIKLNGSSVSEAGLVLRPGERFYLDCFIDDKKKFIFNTYEVESNIDSLNAISKNGALEVYFYKESVVSLSNWRNKFNGTVINRYYPYYNNPYRYNSLDVYCDTYVTNNDNGVYGATNYNTSANIGSIDLTNVLLTSANTIPINSNIETGRVDKGENSNQKFETVDKDFDNYYIASTVLELLPESRKPLDTKKLKKKVKSDQVDTFDLIKKLADLHKSGILTDDEFSNKKKELLSKI